MADIYDSEMSDESDSDRSNSVDGKFVVPDDYDSNIDESGTDGQQSDSDEIETDGDGQAPDDDGQAPDSTDDESSDGDGDVSDGQEPASDGQETDSDSQESGDDMEDKPSTSAKVHKPIVLKALGGHWCYMCKRTIKGSPSKFKRHFKEAHTDNKKIFSCGKCRRSYTTNRSLLRHLDEAHPELKDHLAALETKSKAKVVSKPAKVPKAPKVNPKVKVERKQTKEEIEALRRKARSFLDTECIDVDKEKRKKQRQAAAAAAAKKDKATSRKRPAINHPPKSPPTKAAGAAKKDKAPLRKRPESPPPAKKIKVEKVEAAVPKPKPSNVAKVEKVPKPKTVANRAKPSEKSKPKQQSKQHESDQVKYVQTLMNKYAIKAEKKTTANKKKAAKAEAEAAKADAEMAQSKSVEAEMSAKAAEMSAKAAEMSAKAAEAVKNLKMQQKKSKLAETKSRQIHNGLAELSIGESSTGTAQKRKVYQISSDSGDNGDEDENVDVAPKPKRKRLTKVKKEIKTITLSDDSDDGSANNEQAEQAATDVPADQPVADVPLPTVLQISGPHLEDIQEGRDPFANIPTDYTAANEVLKRVLDKNAASAAASGGDDDTLAELEQMRNTPYDERDNVKFGEVADRYQIERNNPKIASDHCARTLIGFKNKDWCTWSPEFTFFACVSVLLKNKRDSDNLVYVNPRAVKAQVKKLIPPAKAYLRSKGIHLTINGKLNLHAVNPHLSTFYEVVINVYSERHINLTGDKRFLENDWPVLHLLRKENGQFCVIKDVNSFDRVIQCKDCTRMFNNKRNLNRHMTGNRCPFARFIAKYGPEAEEEFFHTPKEDYMVVHSYPGGRVRPDFKIQEKLEKYGIDVGPDFTFNPFYCVSDIETFLMQMTHKSLDGEEKVIMANHKLIFDNHHDPACVSIISNLGGKYSICQTFICMDGSSKFILSYCAYLKEMSQVQYRLLQEKHKPIIDQLKDMESNFLLDNKVSLAKSVGNLIKDMEMGMKKLQVFFYNSVFDLNCLVRHGLCWFIHKLTDGAKVKALKNGNDYISLSGNFVRFLDILKFTAGKVSLPAFLYTYQVPDRYSKMKFPYELMTSPSKLMTPLPVPYESYFSKLRQENTLEAPRAKYESLMENGLTKEQALKEMKMTEEPLTGPEMYEHVNELCREKNITYLYQLLAMYCCMDCTGLMIAIDRMRDSFRTLTNLDMFDFITLPSMGLAWALREVGQYPEPTMNHFVKMGEEAYNLVLPGLRGGATMIGNRLSIAGYTKIKPHQVPPEEQKTVKKQLYLDANALYGGTCKMKNVVLGSYAIRHKKNDFFFEKILERGLGALSWLLFMARVDMKKEIRTIRSVHGEKTILLADGTRAKLDGWLDVEQDPATGRMRGHSFEFHDFTHCHPYLFKNNRQEFEHGINPVTKRPNKESYERTLARDNMIRSHPTVIEHHVMWSHNWQQKIMTDGFVERFVHETITREGPDPILVRCNWKKMLQLILDGKIHGLVVCSLNTPDHLIEKFSIFPPFFNHKKLCRGDICQVERDHAIKHDLLKMPQRVLTNELKVENSVISTDLLVFYVKELGLEVTNIETVVQFKGAAKVLENMLTKCKNYRDEGMLTGRPVKKEIGKLILNGFYGSSLLNMETRRTTVYAEKSRVRHYANRPELASSAFAGPSWDPGCWAELELRKYKVTQKQPKQLGIWILNASKMVLLKFIYNVLYRYLDPTCWEINGLDTDGIIISIAGDDLMSICKPELLDEFRENYKSIFAVDKEQTHVPHLFKTEQESVIFVGLATKSYFMLNTDSPIGKIASKGIPNKTEENENVVGLINFLQTLFDIHPTDQPKTVVRGIRCDKFKNMATYVQMKRGLTRLAAKQGFHQCAIHYFPLELKDDQEKMTEIYPYTDTCHCYDIELAWKQIKRLSVEYPKMKLKIPDRIIIESSDSETGRTLDSEIETRTKGRMRRTIEIDSESSSSD